MFLNSILSITQNVAYEQSRSVWGTTLHYGLDKNQELVVDLHMSESEEQALESLKDRLNKKRQSLVVMVNDRIVAIHDRLKKVKGPRFRRSYKDKLNDLNLLTDQTIS